MIKTKSLYKKNIQSAWVNLTDRIMESNIIDKAKSKRLQIIGYDNQTSRNILLMLSVNTISEGFKT